jgi:ferredoxin
VTVVDVEKCTGCGVCVEHCELGLISVEEGVARIAEGCCSCGACIAACPLRALSPGEPPAQSIVCTLCGVGCRIAPGRTGACQRFTNVDGELRRTRPLQVPERVPRDKVKEVLSQPLVTGVGAGTTYPDYKPAPYIVEEEIEGIDVVTVVTEAPISYSTMVVKIDTNAHVGEEGAKVRRDGKVVGMVTAEQYGSQVLTIGGVNLVKSKQGMTVVRTMAELGNGERVKLTVDGGSVLEVQLGRPPVIDGVEDTKMRVGCGAACIALFAPLLAEVADEVIVLDHHITGLLTEHPAGAEIKKVPSGVKVAGRRGSPGRYFLERGSGWGGTRVTDPRDAIKEIDPRYARPGMRILIAETTWRQVALLVWRGDGRLEQVPIPPEVEELRARLADNCEESRVSVLYYAGVGGSARAGVTVNPIALTRAVHRGEAVLTIGGAPAYVLPGGGITFLADVERMVPRPFSYVPLPALVAPVEYTCEYRTYAAIGGHVRSVRPLREVLREGRFQWWRPPRP